jgi:tetratricopeptide (TPR) repeat protein
MLFARQTDQKRGSHRVSWLAAFSTVLAAGAGLATNAITTGWSWPLGICLVVLVGAWTVVESVYRGDSHTTATGRASNHERLARALGASIVPPWGLLPSTVHGQQSILDEIRSLIMHPDGRAHVLTGIGGAGKTTIALRAADLAKNAAVRTWWIDASSAESTVADVAELLLELGAAPRDVQPVQEGRRALVDALWKRLDQAPGPWLLVIDNADEPAYLAAEGGGTHLGNGLVRGSANGLVLVTSRVGIATAWGTTCVLHGVPRLSATAGAQILVDAVGERAGTLREGAVLADLLAGVPLAIRSAARYLTSSAAALDGITTFKAYGETLDGRFHGLLDAASDPDRPRDSVRLTWEISLDRLEHRGIQQARWIMRLLGEFADAPLPASTIHSETLGRGPANRVANSVVARHPQLFRYWLRAARLLRSRSGARPGECDPALAALVDIGLLDLDTVYGAGAVDAAPCVISHPLVRRHNDALLAEDRVLHRSLFAAGVALVRSTTASLNPYDPSDYSVLAMLAPHVEKMLNRCTDDSSLRNKAAVVQCANVVCLALYGHGDYVRAYSLSALNVRFTRRFLRPGTRVSLAAEHAYCRALLLMGQTPVAVIALRKLADESRRRLGERDQATLSTQFNLAYAERETGQVEKAQAIFQEVLRVRLARLGESHVTTLRTRTYLAETMAISGDLAAARRELEDIRNRCRSVLRPYDHDSLYVGKVLARTLSLTGRLSDAAAIFDQLLQEASRTYAKDHPEIMDIRHGLAATRAQQGRTEEAATMLKDILEARGRQLGHGHPDTVNTAAELSRLHQP